MRQNGNWNCTAYRLISTKVLLNSFGTYLWWEAFLCMACIRTLCVEKPCLGTPFEVGDALLGDALCTKGHILRSGTHCLEMPCFRMACSVMTRFGRDAFLWKGPLPLGGTPCSKQFLMQETYLFLMRIMELIITSVRLQTKPIAE